MATVHELEQPRIDLHEALVRMKYQTGFQPRDPSDFRLASHQA
jgi:hypothetical protein